MQGTTIAFIICIVLVVLLIIGGLVYWLLTRNKTPSTDALIPLTPANPNNPTPTPGPAPDHMVNLANYCIKQSADKGRTAISTNGLCNGDGWRQVAVFKAFNKETPGTVAVCTAQDATKTFTMGYIGDNCGSFDQGYLPVVKFWAYPTYKDGTVELCITDMGAASPGRQTLFELNKCTSGRGKTVYVYPRVEN